MKIKPIKNFPRYFVSDNGKIFSTKVSRRKKELRLHLSFGYPAIRLFKKGKYYKKYVHRLVLETFVGPCPQLYQCRHLDGSRTNNTLKNLKWGSRKENQADRLIHGTDKRGEKSPTSKLDAKSVLKIRQLAAERNKKIRGYDKGGEYKKIASLFGIAASTVGSIVSGKRWGWLK